MKYRAEINGLRALAVLSVILFHAGFKLFSGGLVGVDVFFVISGYLITTILVEDIEKNRFSLVNFYERRARRILPALFFVMLACIPFAWMWMLPDPLENFGQSIVSTTLFSNNILLFITSDYWDLATEFKPLMHTWSLAVEEQYYFLFPIFLIVAWRFGKNIVFWMIVVLAVISLLLSEYGWRNNASANFYLAPTRVWELFAGSIAAFIIQNRGVQASNFLSLSGLVAIIFAIFAYDETTPFPSLYALVPVVGVVMLILYADKQTLAARLLSTKPIVGIGLISYSAYLWHQPLFAFSKVYMVTGPSILVSSVLVLITGLLAALTWRFVERPFRDRRLVSVQVVSISLGVTALLLVTFGYSVHKSHGFKNQVFDENVTNRDMNISYNERNFKFKTDDYDHASSINILVVGNSYGRDVVNVLRETFDIESASLVYRDDFDDCSITQSDLGFNLFQNANLVLFASSYTIGSDSCVSKLIGMSNELNTRLFFIGAKQFGYNLNWIARTNKEERAFLRNPYLLKTMAYDAAVSKAIPKGHYLSIMNVLSNDEGVLVTDGMGRLLSGDRDHLTRYGAIYVGSSLFSKSAISEILESR